MMNPIAAVKGLHAFVSVVRNTKRLEPVFALADSLENDKFLVPVIEDLKRTEEGATALATLRRLPPWDLPALASYPEGSLGKSFYDHLRTAKIDPSALPTLPASDPRAYVRAHLYETHDLWHALTGFDVDEAGELGLQAFYLAQFRSPLALAILAAGFLNTALYAMEDRVRRMDAISVGWGMGRFAKPIFGIDWESLLAEPISEVRKRYRVMPVIAALEGAKGHRAPLHSARDAASLA
ncbi:Coq4 family protein [Pendulispora albinea]|uniref:Coq4 family protein n=1 Tax=Pendulispora albinea TaxID=2741071 RepID=A0ABZ2M1A0_9BACT